MGTVLYMNSNETATATATYVLTNRTTGRSWNYDSEPQLKTAARLFTIQNPKASVAVTINGTTTVLR